MNTPSDPETIVATTEVVVEFLGQFDTLVAKFPSFLRGQCGLSENTVRIYLADLVPLRAFLDRERLGLSEMDLKMTRMYLAWLATEARGGSQGYARVSIARKLTVLRSFYRFLVQEGLFRSSPVPSARSLRVNVEKPLPSFLGHEEVKRLMDAPDDSTLIGIRDRAILELLYSCGMRLAEMHGLDVPAINFARRAILVLGKGLKERWVLFGRPAEVALRRYLQDGRPRFVSGSSQALFLNRYGVRLSRRSVEKLVRRYAGRAGTRQEVHPHTLRHTFATHMLEGGADLRVIQDLLGHSSPTTTEVYTHVTKQEAQTAYLAYHPRSDSRGKTTRWTQACKTIRDGLEELQVIHQGYEAWLDLVMSAKKLEEVTKLDIESALAFVGKAESMGLPLGSQAVGEQLREEPEYLPESGKYSGPGRGPARGR